MQITTYPFLLTSSSPDSEQTPVVSQDMNYDRRSRLFGTCGSFASNATKSSIMTAAISQDGSQWSVGKNASALVTLNRYSAYPSANTWYMSAGFWPDSSPAPEGSKRLSKRLTLSEQGIKVNSPLTDKPVVSGPAADDDAGAPTGYTAQVVKTTDGGETWTSVFNPPNPNYYLNGISCWNTQICAVVGEGETGVVFVTEDGGATWTSIMDTGSEHDSLMTVCGERSWLSLATQCARNAIAEPRFLTPPSSPGAYAE